MKQTLQLKLTQNLALTPQLQQAIRLLQLSTLELGQELDNYLATNPLLEREDDDNFQYAEEQQPAGEETQRNGDESTTESAAEEGPWEGGDAQEGQLWDTPRGSGSGQGDDEDFDYQDIQAAAVGLSEHLNWQLGLTPLGDQDKALVHYLIESLDDNGYLNASLEEIAEEFTADAENPVTIDDLRIALKYLQSLEPAGVGARNTQECLLLQLAADQDDCPEAKAVAITIVEKYLDVLAAHDFTTLKKLVGCKEDTLRAAHELIQCLNPRPGARFAAEDTRYIIPDVIVRKVRGIWTASINPEAFPKLRINRMYAQILQGQNASHLSEQLQEARWLIRNVQQRFETILSVAQTIIDQQRQFFDHGEVAMRPLVMREIAERTGLHESTISRVTTQKYMATPRGIFELKYFFGSHLPTDSGGACSSTAIRAVIRQLIGAENAKKPLSDHKISELLGQQGIIVARRTIAKYREAMGVPPANLRKVL